MQSLQSHLIRLLLVLKLFLILNKQEQLHAGAWNEKSEYEINQCLCMLLELIRDIQVTQIDPEQVLEYKDYLLRFPIHASKKPEYKDLTPKQTLQLPIPSKTISIVTV